MEKISPKNTNALDNATKGRCLNEILRYQRKGKHKDNNVDWRIKNCLIWPGDGCP